MRVGRDNPSAIILMDALPERAGGYYLDVSKRNHQTGCNVLNLSGSVKFIPRQATENALRGNGNLAFKFMADY